VHEKSSLPVDPAVLAARHDLALRASRIGIWDWDVVENILVWDDVMFEVYGTPRDTFGSAYETWLAGVHPDDKLASDAEVKRALAGECEFDTRFRVVWHNGEVHTIRALATVLRDPEGNPVRMIGANWDITPEVRVREALEQSNEDLSQFVYRTSHDLRAPLATIGGLAGLIAEDLEEGDVDEALTNCRKITRHVEKLRTFIDDILALSRANLESAPAAEVDLDILLIEVRARMADFYPSSPVAIRVGIEGPTRIVAPRIRLSQILENLVSNAIKYRNPAEAAPEVVVQFRTTGDQHELSVRDNGLGIPEEFAAQLFVMFKRFHADVAAGSGLGLSIVKRHLDQLRGHIELVPEPKGTHFRLTFPKQTETTA